MPFVYGTHLGDVFLLPYIFPMTVAFFKQNISQFRLINAKHLFGSTNAMKKCPFLVKHHKMCPE